MVQKVTNQAKRKRRVRGKLRRVSRLPRLSVFRSHNHIYGQIISDSQQKTHVAASDLELGKAVIGKTKLEKAKAVGKLIAKKARQAKIKKVLFDRGSYRYHGRVKAFAEGARAEGLVL